MGPAIVYIHCKHDSVLIKYEQMMFCLKHGWQETFLAVFVKNNTRCNTLEMTLVAVAANSDTSTR